MSVRLVREGTSDDLCAWFVELTGDVAKAVVVIGPAGTVFVARRGCGVDLWPLNEGGKTRFLGFPAESGREERRCCARVAD